MYVIKRDGRRESVRLDKIQSRIEKMSYGLDLFYIKPLDIAVKVINGLYDGVTSTELDNLAAETAASMSTQHPDYSLLAARLAVSNLHKSTHKSFSSVTKLLYTNTNERTGESAPLVSASYYKVVRENAALLDEAILHNRDFEYKYFGYKTLERSYLMKVHGRIAERPQHCLMRIAVGIHGSDIPAALETYEMLSNRLFTHATPTMFNAGTPKPQLSSCFLLTMKDDSIDGIYDTLKQCAKISQSAGGIGLAIHNVRAKGSYIKGTGGESNGIVPMLRNFDMTARYVDQGGNKRKGSFAIYLEPWHADIFDLLELKKNHGKEEMRARDLFYGLWVPDLFMVRCMSDDVWSLMCPNECPGLSEVYGEEFERLYAKYEKEGRYRKQIKAQELWAAIIDAQIETGNPYMLFKDAANKKSNQKNLGTIKSSNLCTEIIEYTSPDEVAVCNLASISLPAFVEADEKDKKTFNHYKLYQVTKVITRNLNKVIDINYYPVEEAKNSNMRHRPIGIGVQGLADAFFLLRLPFSSAEAKRLNEDIFETIYYAAMETSMELSKEFGPYESFAHSPLSKGIFQFDMWGVTPKSGRYNWDALKANVVAFGARNSLLVAPMPTASTAQILGNNECFEPITSNLYTRRTLSGDFILTNQYLMADLIHLGLWSETMRQKLIAHKGSIQHIAEIPANLKEIYKTVWEISQRDIIDMSADRGAYICQSQSLNLHLSNTKPGAITSMHFHSWKVGLKTGMYYLRTQSAADAIQFTVDKELTATPKEITQVEVSPTLFTKEYSTQEAVACSISNPEDCEACGS